MAIKNGLVEVGIPWGFNEWTDVEGYYSDMIYNNINIVDFIPIIPKANRKAVEDASSGKISSLFKSLYVPDPDFGCQYYNGMLKKFNLSNSCDEVKGVRLYITDNTQLAETITNEYSESALNLIAGK